MNIGDFDQVQAAFGDLARILMEYYNKLISQGFPPYEAIMLVAEMQKYMLSNK